jgi:hypothetical protein
MEIMQNEKRKNLLSAVLCGNMICNDSLMTKLGDIFENEVGDCINESRTRDSITYLLYETELRIIDAKRIRLPMIKYSKKIVFHSI